MGYGHKALEELEKYFSKELFIQEKPENLATEENPNDEIKPKENVKPLLQKLSESKPVEVDYLGVAYGLNPQLYKFWDKNGYKLVFIKQKSSDITGEYSAIMLKSISETNFSPLFEDFRKRFLNLLSFEFSTLPTSLALNILSPEEGNNCNVSILERFISLYDLKRLEAFGKKLIDFHLILDLLPGITQLYFSKNLKLNFSNLQKSLLIAIALQRKSFASLPKEFNFPSSQIVLLFNKLVKIITQTIKSIFEAEIDNSIPQKLPSMDDDDQTIPKKHPSIDEDSPTKHLKNS